MKGDYSARDSRGMEPAWPDDGLFWRQRITGRVQVLVQRNFKEHQLFAFVVPNSADINRRTLHWVGDILHIKEDKPGTSGFRLWSLRCGLESRR